MADGGAGDDEAELVDGIGRARHQDHVARRRDRLRHVGEALLGAERRHDLGFGIELHAEAARVVGRLRLAQARDALGGGIAIGARLADGLDQLVDDVLGRGHVGIAHAEIDDVGAARAGGRLQAVHLGEHIGRQTLDAMEFFDHGTNRALDGSTGEASGMLKGLLALLDLLGGFGLVGLAFLDHLVHGLLLLVLAQDLLRQLGNVRQIGQRQGFGAATQESCRRTYQQLSGPRLASNLQPSTSPPLVAMRHLTPSNRQVLTV